MGIQRLYGIPFRLHKGIHVSVMDERDHSNTQMLAFQRSYKCQAKFLIRFIICEIEPTDKKAERKI